MKKTVKLAQILAGAPQGGAENFYFRLVKGLESQEHLQQRAFTRPHPERVTELTTAEIDHRTFRFGSKLHVIDRWQYQKALRDFQPDVVLTYMNRATALTPKGTYKLVSRLGHYYDLKYYQHCDYWIGISKGICKHLIDGGMPADRVFHIPNFADETPIAEADKISRDSFNTPEHAPILLAAGRLHVNKGFDVLLESLKALPGVVLWLAGSGPEESALKSLAETLGVKDRVRFLGWRNDIGALLEAADAFVCPSRHEGLGSVVMEAWLHRCPIIATRSQGPSELIEDGKTGLMSPIDDAPALASQLSLALADTSLRESLAEAALLEYETHYSQSHILQRYSELLYTLGSR